MEEIEETEAAAPTDPEGILPPLHHAIVSKGWCGARARQPAAWGANPSGEGHTRRPRP